MNAVELKMKIDAGLLLYCDLQNEKKNRAQAARHIPARGCFHPTKAAYLLRWEVPLLADRDTSSLVWA